MRNTMKNNRTFLEKLLDGAEVKWKLLSLVTEMQRGKTITAKSANEGNIPVISGGQKPAYYHNESNRDGKTITVAGSGAYAGYIMYWEEPIFVSDAFSIKTDESLLQIKYVYHFLLQNQQKIHAMKKGSGVPHVYPKDIGTLMIPIPPLPVQTEIVKILDALTALTSELTSELILRRKQYEYYREKLLSEEELGKVGFEWKTLGDVAKIQRGASPRPISQYITDESNGIPWIKIGDTSLDSKYIENTAQKITIEGAEKSRILKSGDFVMSNSMSYGRPYILKISGAIHDGWASISDFENILNSDFLYYYLSSNTVQSYWNGKINSSSVSNLNSDIIKSLPIPIPTLNIQIEIAKTLDKFETLTNSITDGLPLAIEQSQKRYEYYRELLLNFS